MYRDGEDDPEFMEEVADQYWVEEMASLSCAMIQKEEQPC